MQKTEKKKDQIIDESSDHCRLLVWQALTPNAKKKVKFSLVRKNYQGA